MGSRRSVRYIGASWIALVAAPVAAQVADPATSGNVTPGVAAPAAQGQGTVAASDAVAQGGSLGEIVVTARRREESLQSVPIAITALSGGQLEQKGVRSVEDLRSFSPGLNISGQRRDEAGFYLRGQTPGVIQAGANNFTSVATYFAEVPTSISGPGTFYDLANVQVLKGPQGTLFGRNTTGGAVLFEPARPTQEIEGYIQASVGNYNFHEVQFMANAPLAPDLLSLRIAGVISRRDGYTRSVASGQKLDARDFDAIRASLLFTPGDRLQSLTILDYREKDQPGTGLVLRQINPAAPLGSVPVPAALRPLLGAPATLTTLPIRAGGTVAVGCLSAILPGCPAGGAVGAYRAAFNGGNFADPANGGFGLIGTTAQLQQALATQQALGARRTQIAERLRSRSMTLGITNRSTFDVTDDITLKNIIAFRRNRFNDATDYDGTALNTISQLYTYGDYQFGQDQFTEEFQIQGKLPSAKVNYILGYFHLFSKPGFRQVLGSRSFGAAASRIPDNRDTSDAVFGHLEWQPIPLIGFSGGIRQTWDKRSSTISTFNAAGACTVTFPDPSGSLCPSTYKASFDALTYDGTVNIKPSDRILAYGAYRRGFKSGGFTQPAPLGFQSFRPETVDDFEVGLKADFDIGVPLRTNVALFYDKYKNVQITSPTLIAGSIASVTQNVGKQTNKGIEFEGSIVPIRGFTLSGFFSYTSAESDVQVTGPTGQIVVRAHEQIAFTPKYKYGVSGVWTLPVKTSTGGDVTLSADYSWQSTQTTSDFAAPINTYPSYGLLNARLEWRDAIHRGVDLSIFGTNITNKTYILGGFPLASALGFETAIYGEPRTYGGTIRFRWGS